MGVKITFDKDSVIKRIKSATEKGQGLMAQQALKDSNFYCKQDSGDLIASSIKSSNFKKGVLVWNSVYARKQYYIKTASKDKNPNASEMWAHKAARKKGKLWQHILQKAIEDGV